MKFYISFGQVHEHTANGKQFDKDCICVVDAPDANAAAKQAFDTFGPKWCMCYPEVPDMTRFPRGLIRLWQ